MVRFFLFFIQGRFYMKHISESIIGRRGSSNIFDFRFESIVRGSIVYIPEFDSDGVNPYFLSVTERDLYNLWPDNHINSDLPCLIHYSPPSKYSVYDTPIGSITLHGYKNHFPFYDGNKTPIKAIYKPIDQHKLNRILSSKDTLIDFLRNLHP